MFAPPLSLRPVRNPFFLGTALLLSASPLWAAEAAPYPSVYFLSKPMLLAATGIMTGTVAILIALSMTLLCRRRSAEVLRRSEKRFRSLIEGSLQGIMVHRDGLPLFANRALARMAGYDSPEQMLDAGTIEAYIAPREQGKMMDHLRAKPGAGKIPRSYEFEGVRRDGSTGWLDSRSAVIDWDGEPAIFSFLIDIDERKRAEDALAKERTFLQSVIDGVVDPIMVIGVDHRVLMMNKAANSQMAEEYGGGDEPLCHKLSHRSHKPCCAEELPCPCPLQEVGRTGEPATIVHEHYRDGGEKGIYELKASPLWTEDGTLKGIIVASRDITKRLQVEAMLREKEDHLYHLAHHDHLTDLPNRVLFQDRLQHAMAQVKRTGNHVALLFMDLDRFKMINDSLGHVTGDGVLREVARRLRRCVRSSDTVARLGGDEFVVVLEGIEEIGQVVDIGQKILDSFSRPLFAGPQELHLTTSIGISLFDSDSEDAEELMKYADVAMYRAKEHGGNNLQFYTPDMNARARELLLLENSLRKAMVQDQLLLHYQPQFDLASGAIIGMEALVRWLHPERGMIPPDDFIPMAEQTGLIDPIGEWVMATACAQARAWQDQGLPPVRVGVNISARQFRQADLAKMVAGILLETGLDPGYLELELTESLIMDDAEAAIATMRELHEMGVHLAIDDFGSGYSSLSYLKRLPISRLKIDRSFIRDVLTGPKDAAITTSIIALARNMRLEVIAEGVENPGQLEFLKKRGCEHGQGFLFSRPLPAEELEPLFLKPPPTEGEDAEAV